METYNNGCLNRAFFGPVDNSSTSMIARKIITRGENKTYLLEAYYMNVANSYLLMNFFLMSLM